MPTQWALQIGPFIFVILIENFSAQRHFVDRDFDQISVRSFLQRLLRVRAKMEQFERN